MHDKNYESFYMELQKEAGIGTFAKRMVGKAGVKLFDMGAKKFFRKRLGIKTPKRTPFNSNTIGNKAALYGSAALATPVAAHAFNPKISNMRGY